MTMTNISSRSERSVSGNPLVQAFARWSRTGRNIPRQNRGETQGRCEEVASQNPQLPLDQASAKPAILVPVDFSPASLEAVKCGLNIARRAQGQLVLLHAVNLNLATNSPANPSRLQAALCDEAAARARDILDCARATGVSATCVVEQGPPAAVIQKTAECCKAELIVLGKQRRGWFARLFGSRIAERVIRSVNCPVMVLQIDSAKG